MQLFLQVHSASAIDFAALRTRSWSSRSNLRSDSGVMECVERNGMPHVLFMLIYPSSIEKYLREKIEKLLYCEEFEIYQKSNGKKEAAIKWIG